MQNFSQMTEKCRKREQEWDTAQIRIEPGWLCATSPMCKWFYFILLLQYREAGDSTHIISVGRCCDGGGTFEQEDDEHNDQVLWKDQS